MDDAIFFCPLEFLSTIVRDDRPDLRALDVVIILIVRILIDRITLAEEKMFVIDG
jgi:hypothetical protein